MLLNPIFGYYNLLENNKKQENSKLDALQIDQTQPKKIKNVILYHDEVL